MNRRNFITGVASASTIAVLAGCTSEGEDDPDTKDTGQVESTTDESTTEAGTVEETTTTTTTTNPANDIKLIEHEWYNEEWEAGVKGKVENAGDETLDYVEIEVIFLNEDDEQLGSSIDNTEGLKAGRTWNFDVMYFEGEPGEVSNYEINAKASIY